MASSDVARDLSAAVAACQKELEDASRLACYDRAARNHGQLPESLVATVRAVIRRPNGAHVITLDNGQVWTETSLDPSFRVAVGEQVRIKRAAMGTYLLSTPSNRSTRVARTD